MTRKFLIHLFLFVSVLALLWLGLTRINFRTIFKTDQRIEQLEERLGKWTLRFFMTENSAIGSPEIDSLLTAITSDLFQKNSFNTEINFYFIRNDTPNAFALPGNNIVFFTGIIDFVENEDEFLGIIAHEIAHIEENHVMKKLSKEIGLAALFTMISGSYNRDVIREIARTLTSTAYDRNLEREADKLAFEYLVNAGINPQGFINLLRRFGDEADFFPKELHWISTHPDSHERAQVLDDMLKNTSAQFNRRNQDLWDKLKTFLKKDI